MNASVTVTNAWPNATIYVQVIDINDNSPIWVIPPYPRQTTLLENTYLGIISNQTGSAVSVLTIHVSFKYKISIKIISDTRTLTEERLERSGLPKLTTLSPFLSSERSNFL